MHKALWLVVALCTMIFAAGCASDGSFVNPFASNEPAPASPYFFSEISDVPIPNDMSEVSGETFVTFAQGNVKSGTQLFRGRVELVSLMNTMRRNMASSGWTLHSLLRSKESVLSFGKDSRICTLVFSDGMVFTDMRVFVSPKLSGDSSSLDVNAYSTPVPTKSSGSSSGASSSSKSKSSGSSGKLTQ